MKWLRTRRALMNSAFYKIELARIFAPSCFILSTKTNVRTLCGPNSGNLRSPRPNFHVSQSHPPIMRKRFPNYSSWGPTKVQFKMDGSPTMESLYNLWLKNNKQIPLEMDPALTRPPSNIGRRNPRLCHNGDRVDGFSKLPDDIIIGHILPRLDIKASVRTSVLSRRWKYLWRHNLGTELVFTRGVRKSVSSKARRERYVTGVDSILQLFSAPKLDHFSICFDMDYRFDNVISRWLTFAIRKEVKRLNVNLAPFSSRSLNELVKFPYLKRSINRYGGICYLKELFLNHVRIRGKAVEYLLSCCPFLEILSLQASISSNLKISGSSLKLKRLEILQCKTLPNVEVSATNLITFKCDGSIGDLLLSNASLVDNSCLSNFYYKRFVAEFVQNPLQQFSYCFELKTMEFHMPFEEARRFPLEHPNFVKLEELTVTMEIPSDVLMLWPIGLLKSAPRLQKFAIKQVKAFIPCMPSTTEELEKRRGASEFTHSCLKVLEVTGFGGNPEVCEMIECVLSIAASSLEKLVIKYDKKETMWNNRIFGSRPEIEKAVLRRIKNRLPVNCRLTLK